MSKLIVAVDDSKTIRASLEYTLTKEGYEVVLAKDGQEGVEKLKELKEELKKPAMIITDINMPRMDGIEFIKEAKKMSFFKFTPILVLTTESQDKKKMEGKKAGAAGWLVKPFKQEQLLGVIQKFVK
ncbi:response regulator [Natroniella sulfidigena]|uniref:response regulator n=1 Tax=Natroniella sulfidigena TaxID=723921 RepID=UPI00200B428E|nr:response regulator [Natroniella sulfidigena]MCK8816825.1 response regulator [Natroniella sulfidigena]